MLNCSISNNTAALLGGGIIYASVVSNCVVKGNKAFAGGGIFTWGGEYYDCEITENQSTATSKQMPTDPSTSYSMTCGGGGVSGSDWGGGPSYGVFYNCKIHDNTSASFGGGALFVRLYNCHVYKNKAVTGAGGYALWAFSSLITENVATGNGGGVFGGGLYNCTVTKNKAGEKGGGVYTSIYAVGTDSSRSVACYNTIVYGNTADEDSSSADGFLGYWYNSCVGYLYSDMNTVKTGLIFKNPSFVDSSKGDYRLSSNSPCINAGDNKHVDWEYDYSGLYRIANDIVDIGAYEYNAVVADDSGTETPPPPPPPPSKPELGVGDYSVAGDNLVGTVPENAASVYDGYLYLKNTVVGTIQVKVSKPKLNKRLGVTTAKTSVAIQVTGEKKITLKGELDLNIGEFTVTDKKSDRELNLKLGIDGITGTFGKYDIDGARNFFDSKDKSEKSTAEEILKPYLGAYSMILDGGILSVTIAKKGKVTIKGNIDGNKVSLKAQALIGEKMICIPVIYSKKSVNLAFTIWLPINGGDAEIIGLGDNAIIGKAGTLKNGAKFVIDGDIGDFIETEDPRTLELLPDNETITVSKSKWLVADGIKPAKVAYKKGEFTITEGKKGAGIVNPSGLKLTYKSKDGSFSGSFTAYAIVKGKLKKHKATVEGVLVNGVGYGTITIKRIGTWAVTIK